MRLGGELPRKATTKAAQAFFLTSVSSQRFPAQSPVPVGRWGITTYGPAVVQPSNERLRVTFALMHVLLLKITNHKTGNQTSKSAFLLCGCEPLKLFRPSSPFVQWEEYWADIRHATRGSALQTVRDLSPVWFLQHLFCLGESIRFKFRYILPSTY